MLSSDMGGRQVYRSVYGVQSRFPSVLSIAVFRPDFFKATSDLIMEKFDFKLFYVSDVDPERKENNDYVLVLDII